MAAGDSFMNRHGRRLGLLAAAVCLGLCGAVFCARGQATWTATRVAPGVAVTSGFEEESLFAVWRAAHGQPVYADGTRLPFASAYFNWLFYAGYAAPVRLFFPEGGAGLVATARAVTVAGAVVGAGGLFFLLRRILGGEPLLALALAGFAFAGPLVGWWSFTVRPDVWAVGFETLAMALLLLGWRARPQLAALAAAVLFYAAWSCKSTYVVGLGAAGLFLLCRRQWPALLLLAGVSGLLWVATFAALGPEYRAAFSATARTNVYLLSHGGANLRDMLAKTLPLWVLVAWLALPPKPDKNPSPLAGDALLYAAAGLGPAMLFNFAGACKVGAASYYYFPSLMLLTLLGAALIARHRQSPAIPVALALAAGIQLLALLGRAGHVSLSDQTRSLAATWQAWHAQPEPRFSAVTGLNLPWLSTGSPPLVLAFNYGLDREAGRVFERGGVGGMIAAGYFRSLLLPAETGATYDGGSLQHYERGEEREGFAIYRLRGNPVP